MLPLARHLARPVYVGAALRYRPVISPVFSPVLAVGHGEVVYVHMYYHLSRRVGPAPGRGRKAPAEVRRVLGRVEGHREAPEALPLARARARREVFAALAVPGGHRPYVYAAPRPGEDASTLGYLTDAAELVACPSPQKPS